MCMYVSMHMGMHVCMHGFTCVCGHMGAHTCACMFTCGGPRLMLRTILVQASTLFFEAASLSQTQSSQIMATLTSQLTLASFVSAFCSRITGEPSCLPGIHVGAGDLNSVLLLAELCLLLSRLLWLHALALMQSGQLCRIMLGQNGNKLGRTQQCFTTIDTESHLPSE